MERYQPGMPKASAEMGAPFDRRLVWAHPKEPVRGNVEFSSLFPQKISWIRLVSVALPLENIGLIKSGVYINQFYYPVGIGGAGAGKQVGSYFTGYRKVFCK